jgi:ribulose-phosphate 3-epimerase
MKASVSLWSADLLNLRAGVRRLEHVADEFHLDVMDGNCVPDLLFGLDFVRALVRSTTVPMDVHLMLTQTSTQAAAYAAAGARIVTIHQELCNDVRHVLKVVRASGSRAGLVVRLRDSLNPESLHLDLVDRLLVMGTEIGVKGEDLDPATPQRVERLVSLRRKHGLAFDIFVDGGIRRQTVQKLASVGADGVVPGSLVFGAPDPIEAVSWIHALGTSLEGAA